MRYPLESEMNKVSGAQKKFWKRGKCNGMQREELQMWERTSQESVSNRRSGMTVIRIELKREMYYTSAGNGPCVTRTGRCN